MLQQPHAQHSNHSSLLQVGKGKVPLFFCLNHQHPTSIGLCDYFGSSQVGPLWGKKLVFYFLFFPINKNSKRSKNHPLESTKYRKSILIFVFCYQHTQKNKIKNKASHNTNSIKIQHQRRTLPYVRSCTRFSCANYHVPLIYLLFTNQTKIAKPGTSTYKRQASM